MAKQKAPTTILGTFEDENVVRLGIEIPNASGGLNDALEVDPRLLKRGDRVQIVHDCVVVKIRYEPADKTKPEVLGEVRRVAVLHADNATFMDSEDVRAQLEAQAVRIEEARGVIRLPTAEVEAHERGEHASGLVESCPACANEKALAEAESQETPY